MSKNFELMRRAGNGFERKQSAYLDVQTEQFAVSLRLAPAVESRDLDWLRALDVLEQALEVVRDFRHCRVSHRGLVSPISPRRCTKPRRAWRSIPSGEVFSLEGSAGASDAEYLETQAQVLQSDGVAVDVIRKLHLDQNPELVGKPATRKRTSNAAGPRFHSRRPATQRPGKDGVAQILQAGSRYEGIPPAVWFWSASPATIPSLRPRSPTPWCRLSSKTPFRTGTTPS